MTKDVLVSIKGLQFQQEPENEETETITPAEYFKKRDGHYIIYDEVTEGFDEKTKNIIHIKDHELNITKRGAINVQMLFEENKKNLTSYGTPFGSIMIGIDAKKVDYSESDDSMQVSVDYTLELNYEHYADCKILMDIRSKETGTQILER